LLEISSDPVLRFYRGAIKKYQRPGAKKKKINYASFVVVLLDISP